MRRTGDEGVALLLVLLATAAITALGLSMMTMVGMEVHGAGNTRDAAEAFQAADAGVDLAVRDLAPLPDFHAVVAGAARSPFVDSGAPVTPSGDPLNLVALTAELQAESDAASARGADDPQWRLFAFGPLSGVLPANQVQASTYILIWVADDGSETDGNAAVDSNGIIRVRASAYGYRGTRRDVDAVLARTLTPGVVRLVSWREMR